MPTIDVCDIILDGDFAESFTVTRRAETVNTYGESTVTETSTTAYGVVQPDTGADTVRGADGQLQPSTITVHTPYRLIGPASGYQPDVVTWQGQPFIVSKINNFSQYGRGFIAAKCEAIAYQGPAP